MVARLSVNGIDTSGNSVNRNLFSRRAAVGQPFYDEDLARQLVRDNRSLGFMAVDGALINDTTAASIYFADHFKAATINSAFDKTAGNDGDVVAFAVDTTVKAGGVKGTTGNAGTGAAADAITLSLNNPIQLTATSVVEFSTSLKLSAVTSVYFFIGFTDTLPGTTLELPTTLSTVTYTTTASNAVGFMFDTAATTDTVRLTGVANDVDAAHLDTGFAPVLATTYDFHIRLEGTTAYFTIDGQTFTSVNYLAAAAAISVNLYPIVCVCARTTSTRDATVDFFRGGKFAA
jgi:hypothetical protein